MQEPSTRLEHARALREARDQVLSALMEIPGLNPLPNRGPWIAFCCPGRSGAELATGLGSQGIQAHHSEHWSWRDAVVLAVPHRPLLEHSADDYLGLMTKGGVLVDLRGVLPGDYCRERSHYWRL